MRLGGQHIHWTRQLFVVLGLSIMLFASSCRVNSSRNRNGKGISEDSLKTDFFQNLTSKYNILHNANLMLDAERKAVFHAADKNYQVRLSVFDEPTSNGDPHKAMDSLIQKAYKIVNDKQESKYINDAYFLIGRAYYFKGSYYTAAEFFDKLIKDNSPNQHTFKALAYAWKSRALLQINKTALAGKVVDSAFMFLDEDKKIRTFVNAAKANYLVRIGQETTAIPFLEYAIASNKDIIEGYRWKFLLAQLYRDNKQQEASQKMFSDLANSNVPFDMAFEADLQAAYLTGNKTELTLEQRSKPFLRMLKEGKNDEYQDQILYEIGKIYLDKNELDNAMRFFQQSLQKNNKNAYQATDTYLTMADYFFEKEQYQKAQFYYDSAAVVLPANYTDVNKVRRKLTYLSELTKLYEENLWQDTLLSLASLTEEERIANVTAFAERALQRATQKKPDESTRSKRNARDKSAVTTNANSFAQANDMVSAGSSVATGNAFYFNNQDALLLGAAAFKRKWGNRQRKDDWRFSKDNSLAAKVIDPAMDATAIAVTKDSLDVSAFLENHKRKYLDAVPLTEKEVLRVQKIVHDNMLIIGNLYRDYTRDQQDAIQAYERLLERFPNTSQGAAILYSLYNMYETIDPSKALEYKNHLITGYPTSIHAMLAKDRYYMDKVNRDKRVLDRAFERLFTLYAAGDHVSVIKLANEALQGSQQSTTMAAQIDYLKALAIGRVGRVSDFTFALEKIVQKYPTDSLVVPLALKNIEFMEQNPAMFVHRVNALHDKDKLRVAFLDEPDMTPWPTLQIYGDYRTGIALHNEKPKKEELEEAVLLVEEPKKTTEERAEIALLLAQELSEGNNTVKVADVQDVKALKLKKKQDIALSNLLKETDEDRVVVEQVADATPQRATLDGISGTGKAQLAAKNTAAANFQLDGKAVAIGDAAIDFGPNEYRDKKLFPDTATYYFAINVLDPRVNLAPSRYGVGQFNRSRYPRASINHQLKLVNAENQLLFVGPFETFEEVKTYETRILPLLPEIMKVPQEDYNSFVITREVLGTLTDGILIKNYHQVYIEQ